MDGAIELPDDAQLHALRTTRDELAPVGAPQSEGSVGSLAELGEGDAGPSVGITCSELAGPVVSQRCGEILLLGLSE
eukprot:4829723-Prorocentrum_lima.AAC.1